MLTVLSISLIVVMAMMLLVLCVICFEIRKITSKIKQSDEASKSIFTFMEDVTKICKVLSVQADMFGKLFNDGIISQYIEHMKVWGIPGMVMYKGKAIPETEIDREY